MAASKKPRKQAILDTIPDVVSQRMEDFVWDAEQAGYWEIQSGKFYQAAGINSLISKEYWPLSPPDDDGKQKPIKPSDWMRQPDNVDYIVTSTTWWPGEPRMIKGKLMVNADDPIIDPRYRMYNRYREPPKPLGVEVPDPEIAPWLDHFKALYADPLEQGYFLDYCAHMVQRPAEKCNNIITLSGAQGIGKDLMLLPIKWAIGSWNVRDITPDDLASQYNPWVECVMLVVNEMRATKEDFHATSIYEKLKRIGASPPKVLGVDEKYMTKRFIPNVLRTFITTNNMHSMFIDADDRRMAMIMHSERVKGWQPPEYFSALARWYDTGGLEKVATWLQQRDISAFQPGSMAPSTDAHKSVIGSWGPPDDAVKIALDALRHPDVFFQTELYRNAFDGADEIKNLLKFPRKAGQRLRQSGYSLVEFPSALTFVSAEGKTIKHEKAFVKAAMWRSPDVYMPLLQARGELIAKGVAIIATPLATKTGGF